MAEGESWNLHDYHTMLILWEGVRGGGLLPVLYTYIHAILQGQTALVAASVFLSLTDGGLPDITHSVRQPLILNITAAVCALLFIYLLSKFRHNSSSIKKVSSHLRIQTRLKSESEFLPRKGKRKWPSKKGHLASRAVLVGPGWPKPSLQRSSRKKKRRRRRTGGIDLRGKETCRNRHLSNYKKQKTKR